MAQEVVCGPGGEGHLGHQARVDPAGAALIGSRDRDERRRVALNLAQALGELAAGGEAEAGARLAGKDQLAAIARPGLSDDIQPPMTNSWRLRHLILRHASDRPER